MMTSSPDPQNAAEGRTRRRSVGHGRKSLETRERAIVALLAGRTFTDAAKRCGVAERTLRKWTSTDEAFKQNLKRTPHEAFTTGLGRIQAATATAVDTLIELMTKKAPPTVRLGAARTVAELAIHAFEIEG